MILTQSHYVEKVLSLFAFSDYKLVSTPYDASLILKKNKRIIRDQLRKHLCRPAQRAPPSWCSSSMRWRRIAGQVREPACHPIPQLNIFMQIMQINAYGNLQCRCSSKRMVAHSQMRGSQLLQICSGHRCCHARECFWPALCRCSPLLRSSAARET